MSTHNNEYFTSTSMEIILDDQSLSIESNDEESQSQYEEKQNETNSKQMSNDEETNYSQHQSLELRNPKSHRLIEKRRRDRLNRSLAELLDLVPHKKPENQRRIEKIEIIDMAIKYIRHLMSINKNSYSEEKPNVTVKSYRHGYQHGASDIYEFVEKYSTNRSLKNQLLEFIRQRDFEMGDLTVVPEKTAKIKGKKSVETRCQTSEISDELFNRTDTNPSQSSEQLSTINQPKVPSFVLHPSGTHYIPICLDASVIAQAFPNPSNKGNASQSLQCHPVSIPVNFHPSANVNESSLLDVQNINVIGSIHQPSVRPK